MNAETNAIFKDIKMKRFRSFDDASKTIILLMSKLIAINTLFIAKNNNCINEMVKVFNRDNVLLEEGDTLPFEETYCKLAVEHGMKPLIIPDITKSELSKDLHITKNLGTGSFIGIPIFLVMEIITGQYAAWIQSLLFLPESISSCLKQWLLY